MPIRVKPLEEKIAPVIEKIIRKQLGLSTTDPLPADVATFLRKTVTTSASKAMESRIEREAFDLAKDEMRELPLSKWKNKVKLAGIGIDEIAGSPDVDNILNQRAVLLKKKIESLIANDFNRTEAMQILLTDLSGHSH
jgi:hypothetical protein